MSPHEEHEEDENGQSEIVMILVTDDLLEQLALQLGRREGFDAHLAKKTTGAVDHLEAVAVDQANCRILGNQHATSVRGCLSLADPIFRPGQCDHFRWF